jgi:hypothetical protein
LRPQAAVFFCDFGAVQRLFFCRQSMPVGAAQVPYTSKQYAPNGSEIQLNHHRKVKKSMKKE